MIRATAMVRMNSNESRFASFSSGVPFTFTSMLMGTLSGWRGRLASAIKRPARSFACSPMPTMPPEQTFMPAPRTCSRVSSLS